MKKLVAFMLLLAGLSSISFATFEQFENDDVKTQNLAKEDDDEVRCGTENEGVFLF